MIYAMSDIHGCIDAFEKSLSFVDLSDGRSMLILCGDYCDRGPASLEVYQKIIGLQHDYPNQVIALRGNHEEMLLEYCAMVGDRRLLKDGFLPIPTSPLQKAFLRKMSSVR